jgi:hypothetical protein
MDGSVFTIVESVKELGNGMRDCFEDNLHTIFVLKGQAMLPDVSKIVPPLEFEYNINVYGVVPFILNEFKKRENVLYKMHLTEGLEDIYKPQTVTDEKKIQVNGLDNIYKAISYRLEGNVCNYIVKMIKVPNTNNRFTYRFMNIFEIIDQYRLTSRRSGGGDELDSRMEDMKNIVLDGDIPRKRKHNSHSDSYASLKTMIEFHENDDS